MGRHAWQTLLRRNVHQAGPPGNSLLYKPKIRKKLRATEPEKFSVSNESSVFPEEAKEDHSSADHQIQVKEIQDQDGADNSDSVKCCSWKKF
jgi:hypothetical protein